jgi:hypothetical protein
VPTPTASTLSGSSQNRVRRKVAVDVARVLFAVAVTPASSSASAPVSGAVPTCVHGRSGDVR